MKLTSSELQLFEEIRNVRLKAAEAFGSHLFSGVFRATADIYIQTQLILFMNLYKMQMTLKQIPLNSFWIRMFFTLSITEKSSSI